MQNAFDLLFKKGYQKIVIVGSDIYELNSQDIEGSFITLKTSSYVIGPAKDGGYYLLGMRQLNKNIFENKNWGTDTVFKDTIENLKENVVVLLSEKNDIDIDIASNIKKEINKVTDNIEDYSRPVKKIKDTIVEDIKKEIRLKK